MGFLGMHLIVVGGEKLLLLLWVSRLVHHIDFFGPWKIFLQTCSTISSDVLGRPDPFLVHKQPSSLNFSSHVRKCIAVCDCIEKSITNACCTILYDCDRAYSNTQNTFYLPVKGISMSVKIKTTNFDLFQNMLIK